jgi:hypothetical protein
MIEFTADGKKVNGPRIDGSYTVTFELGEYEAGKIADLIRIPQQTTLKVSVEVENG